MTIEIFRPLDWHWISLIGPDAQDLLHRISTVNTRGMQPGEGAPGFILSAQGKVRAAFSLWNYRDAEYAFEVATGSSGRWKKELLSVVDQYIFAEKVAIAEVNELESRWIFLPSGSAAPETLGRVEAGKTLALDDEIRVCNHGSADYGRPWISVWGRAQRLAQWIDRTFPDALTLSEERLEHWRIDAVRPKLDSEITEATIPLEVGLKDAIAENKGCYPGQEVIERIVSLGSPARRLSRIEGKLAAGQTSPSPGEKVLNDATPPAEIGEISSSYREGDHYVALALLRKIHAKIGLPITCASGVSGTVAQVSAYTSPETGSPTGAQ